MEKRKIIIIIGIIAVVIVIGVASMALKSGLNRNTNNNSTPAEPTSNSNSGSGSKNSATNSETISNPFLQPSTNTNKNAPPSSSPFTITPQPTSNEITYSVFGYSPSRLEVTKGTTVIFKNATQEWSMWPASTAHPTHKEYPTTGGCAGSTFDACKEISVNESWSFTFNEIGTWRYHDHLLPSREGIVVVK